MLPALGVLVALAAVSCSWFGEHPRLAMRAFNDQYGTQDLRLDDCAVCHASRRSLNEYGSAVRAVVNGVIPESDNEAEQLIRAALVAIEEIDSDGDGVPNGIEIGAGTFPGDTDDVPAR